MPTLRALHPSEREAWLHLRQALWSGPGYSEDDLRADQDRILTDNKRNGVFVVEIEGLLVGFVEVTLRDWAEGCRSTPVGYIEGWYLDPDYRRQGLGRALIALAEDWSRERGCTEMGSDALIDNHLSHQAHHALGYREVERIVLFCKHIDPAPTAT